jgi:TolA-binding protein
MKRLSIGGIVGWILFAVITLPVTSAQADLTTDAINQGRKAANEGDYGQALTEILGVLQQQQQTLDVLMRRSQDQQEVINRQNQIIENQQSQLAEQKEKIAAAPQVPEGFSDNYSADKQYDIAYDIQHIAIFEVRRKDAPPYFRKAAEEFRKVVNEHPSSEKADDAQYRVAKIYHRYLKEYAQAIREYEILLEKYPQSEYVDEARSALGELR